MPTAARKGKLFADMEQAQRLVVHIWKLRRDFEQERGALPSGVVLSPEDYRALKAYKAQLGTLNIEALEYLGRYRIFDLTIYVEPGSSCHVIP